MDKNEQKEFERYWETISELSRGYLRSRRLENSYSMPQVAGAWRIYQAAHASRQPEIDALEKRHEDVLAVLRTADEQITNFKEQVRILREGYSKIKTDKYQFFYSNPNPCCAPIVEQGYRAATTDMLIAETLAAADNIGKGEV